MREFFEWFRSTGIDQSEPWLILGKGPTLDRRRQFDLSGYRLLSLNHAVSAEHVQLAHLIDLDVVDSCGRALLENADFVVMPWVPHLKNRPARESLAEIVPSHEILRTLAGAGRLLWYNLSTAGRVNGSSPVIPVRFFSAEAALNLLAEAGVRTVRTLGVDGGRQYSTQFDDIASKTLLANGRSSFDCQFESIAATLMRTGIDFAPLDVESPVRVFVGAMPEQSLAVKVLEYSIRRHASMSVEVTPLYEVPIEIPVPLNAASRPRTPFSFQRFLIPAATGYRGHAIYLDSDMLVFSDIKELWSWPMTGSPLVSAFEPGSSGRRPQFSVMLLDCAALRWDVRDIVARLDRAELTYSQLVHDMALAPSFRPDIPSRWNSLERFEDGETALLHFTDMSTQPWLDTSNPRGYLWCRSLFAAIDAGFVSADYVASCIARGHVRPSLGAQLEARIEDPLLLPEEAIRMDRGFVPPHQSAAARRFTSPLTGISRKFTARVRSGYEKSGLSAFHRRIRERIFPR